MDINSAKFVMSNTDVKKCPQDNKPEYAFIGRSNVGKSSLINEILNKKLVAALKSGLKVIFCIGEVLEEKSKYLWFTDFISIGMKNFKRAFFLSLSIFFRLLIPIILSDDGVIVHSISCIPLYSIVSIVASLAAQEVPGVLRMSGRRIDGINEFLGKESVYKGVRVSFDKKTVTCNVYVIIEYGFCIPEVALEIQEKVKDSIENMTGYDVQFIDVHVQGVAKREKSELEKEAAAIAEAGLFGVKPLFNDLEVEAEAEARHKQFFEED